MSLLSPQFILFAGGMIVLVTFLRGWARRYTFLAGNIFFLVWIALGPIGAASAIAFCLVGYALVRHARRGGVMPFWMAIAALVVPFLYMRDYAFLAWIFPDDWRTDRLKTAGLSFVLFRTLHSLIEARSGTLGRCDWVSFLNYNLSFTTFLSGPIQRFQDFRDQWEDTTKAIPLTAAAHLDAVNRILLGYVKAFVIGTLLEPLILSSHQTIGDISIGDALVGFYAFYPYLYFNFSGYCDIVIGIGSLLGVRPPENFNKPFLARNVSDFWLRMHRSLTLWLTDYVFSPLYKAGLSSPTFGRFPLATVSGALMVTMVVSGLWHGTTISFLIFGLLHGVYLVVYRLWEWALQQMAGKKAARAWQSRYYNRIAAMLITYHAVSLAYVFFDLDVSSGSFVVRRLLSL